MYEKTFSPTEYLSVEDLNDLIYWGVSALLYMGSDVLGIDTSSYPYYQYRDWNDSVKYNFSSHHYFYSGDFIFSNSLKAIEGSIMQLSYDFMQPPGYIQNKIWDTGYEGTLGFGKTSNTFGAEDLNRIVTDQKLLYDYLDKWDRGEIRFPIYNLYSDENWEQESSLEWE